jgi:hypothetical protein
MWKTENAIPSDEGKSPSYNNVWDIGSSNKRTRNTYKYGMLEYDPYVTTIDYW